MELTFPWIISILVFLMAMTGSVALYGYWSAREGVKLWRRRAESRADGSDVPWGGHPWIGMAKDWLDGMLERLGTAASPNSVEELSHVRQQLTTAGFRNQRAPVLFSGSKLLSAFVLLAGFALIPVKWLGFPTANTLLSLYVIAAIAGYFVPMVWLRIAVGRRQAKLLAAVPDALDLLVVCVEAGLGLDMAIARVGDEIRFSHKELGEEFHLLALELRTGLHRREALRNFARRTDLEDVRTLVALLVQTDRFGTSIGQALRVHSEAMKVTRQMRAEELAAKLPVKLLVPLIFFIFPSLFIAILGPAVIKIIRILLPMMQR